MPTGPLPVQAAPHVRALEGADSLLWTLAACALVLAVTGWVFYGPRTVLLALLAVGSAGVTEGFCAWLSRRWSPGSGAHSVSMGLLVVLMLPATAPWYVAAAGAVLAVGLGKWLMGGLGHYPWHPAIVGVLVIYLLWPDLVCPQRWPLLSREHILAGNSLQLGPLEPAATVVDWAATPSAESTVGFAAPRPEMILHEAATGRLPAADGGLTTAVRDLLPSWTDMLVGAVPAPIGQGSVLVLAAVALVLMWRGYLSWVLPAGVVTGAWATAAVLPVAGEAGWGWFPVGYAAEGVPVGLIWTGYHALLGSTLFAGIMLASETVTSPLTTRGQAVYGLGVGILVVALRYWPVALMSGYWAVLMMNTLVPAIDGLDRRWRIVRRR